MATTRIMPLYTGKGRTAGTAISDILDYVQKAKMLFFITMQNPFFVIPTLQSYELRKSGGSTVRAIFGLVQPIC